MKRLLLILLLLPVFVAGQIPIDSFYVPGAQWTEVATTTLWPCSTGPTINTFGIVYKIERDSIISGKTYHLVSSCGKGGYGFSTDCNTGTETHYADSGSCNSQQPIFAMIRTDSNRVYFTLLVAQAYYAYYCDTVGKEYLFYDFNLGIGSVVPTTTLGGGITVSSIDSVSLSSGVNVPRYNGSLIYGIGSEYGFINYWSLYICGPGPNASQYLLCYDNPHFYYHFSYPPGTLPGNLQNDCFDMVTYLSVPNINAASIARLYPNPATNELTISAPERITSIAISNLLGQTLYTHEYNSQQVQIDVANLPKGMYLVRINGSDVRKFVKQ